MSHIEGDGVIEDIYYLLWRKDSPYKERLNIFMPDTIVFRKGRPMAWYFTNSEGVVLRKKQTSLVYEEILTKFTKKASEGDIIAYFINVDDEKKLEKLLDRTYFEGPGKQEQKERKKELPKHEVEYFGLKEFKHTFSDYKNFEGKTGILQRFIHPYGTNNELIQAIWSPRVCVFTKRVNLRRLNETRFDVYERALTFDGPDFYSKNVPLRGGYIPGKLRATCDNIVRHIAYISYEKISINRLVGYFKVDQNENVWFLWTSSIRINETSKVHKKLSEYVDKPLCLEPCMQTSNNIRHIKTNFASRPVTLQMNEDCTVCSKRVSKVALMSVTYRLLLGNEEILKRSEQSASQARLTKTAKHYDDDASKPLTIRKASIGVPYFIKKLHPEMKLRDFQTLRDKEHFLIMKADVCEECYLTVSKEYEGGFPYNLTEAKKHSMLNATQSSLRDDFSRRPETVGSNERHSSNKKLRPIVDNDDSNEEDNVMERSNRGDASSAAITVLESSYQKPQGLKGHKARLFNILPKDSPENIQVANPPNLSLTAKASSFPKFLNRTAWGHISSSFNKPGRLTGTTGESAYEETKLDSFNADNYSLKKDVMKVMGRESENSFRFRSVQSANKSQSNTSLAQIPSHRAPPAKKTRPQTTVAKENKGKPAKFFKAAPKKKEETSKYKLDEVPDLFDDSNQDSQEHEFEDLLEKKMARNSENEQQSYTSGPSQRETLRAVVAANNVKTVKRVQIQEVDHGRYRLQGYLSDFQSEPKAENQIQEHLDQDMVLILANDAQKRQGKSVLIREKMARKENASASSSSFTQRLDTQGSSNMHIPSKVGLSSMRAASAKSSNLRFNKQDTFNEKNIIKELEDKIDQKFAKSYEEL